MTYSFTLRNRPKPRPIPKTNLPSKPLPVLQRRESVPDLPVVLEVHALIPHLFPASGVDLPAAVVGEALEVGAYGGGWVGVKSRKEEKKGWLVILVTGRMGWVV